MKKAKESGTRFANALAKGLEETGNSYALIVLNENPKMFGSYTMKKFKAMVSNVGYDKVAEKIPDLSANERKNIKSTYQNFKNHLDTFTNDYSRDPTQGFINSLKDSINKKA